MRLLIPGVFGLLMSAAVSASPPLDPAMRSEIAAVLPDCKGGWSVLAKPEWKRVGPLDLAPSVSRLDQPSQALDGSAASDLYKIGRALFPQP